MRYSILLVSAIMVTAACTSTATNTHNTSLNLERIVVADGFASPWSIAFLDSGTLLVTEREGGLVRVDLDTGSKSDITGLPNDLVNDIRSEVRFDNGGLFDVAIDPAFGVDPWVYISYASIGESGLPNKAHLNRSTTANKASGPHC